MTLSSKSDHSYYSEQQLAYGSLTGDMIRKENTSMRVTNLNSPRSGSPVANQYEILSDDGSTSTFQSYKTVIAKNVSGHFVISGDWNYSVTTTKYFNQWLRSFGLDAEDIAGVKKFLKSAKNGDRDLSRSRFTLEFTESL